MSLKAGREALSGAHVTYVEILSPDNQLKRASRLLPRALTAKPFSGEPSFAGGYGWQAVEMPQKALCGEFYQSTCMSPSCVFRAYNAPYNAFVSVV